MRGIRSVRVTDSSWNAKNKKAQKGAADNRSPVAAPVRDLGSSIFGVAPPSANNGLTNPFSSLPTSGSSSNPFSSNPFSTSSANPTTTSSSPKPAAPAISDLPTTFAQKIRLSSPPLPEPKPAIHPEPWPSDLDLPHPYPAYHLDADYETLDPASEQSVPPPPPMDLDDPISSTSASVSAAEDTETFESTLDKTFLRFADRLAQNPLQILRYDFRGFPLLYSKTDTVGTLLATHQPRFAGQEKSSGSGKKITTAPRAGSAAIGIPACHNCGAGRVFELQLTPQTIAELEVEEEGLEGMEWGSVLLGVCGMDCGGEDGGVRYVEEWVGVQWEERGRL